MKKVTVYTDGSSLGNPGPGGYGAILMYNGHEKIVEGGEAHTTNNRMELRGVIEALKALKEPCEVALYSDSKYVIDCITQGWVYNWRDNNWRKADKSEALNIDLWQETLSLLQVHQVKFFWVKGHADNEYNNRCDKIATDFAKSLKEELS